MRRQVQVGASARDAAAPVAAAPTGDTAEVGVQATAQEPEVEAGLAHLAGRRAAAEAEVGVQAKEVLLAGAAGQSKVLQSLNLQAIVSHHRRCSTHSGRP